MNQRTKVNVFGAFHYDVAYRATFEGYLPLSMKIIDAGLKLLAEKKDFIFAIEQVILAREYLRKNPSVKPEMRKFAKEGRLIFAPGMFTMPDVNIPSGESFIMNSRIGRKWLKDNLDIEPSISWMADIFGHHAQIPQIATLCGFKAYMFERGKNCGDDVTFWWQGIDGTRLLTQWEIDTYYGVGMPIVPYFLEKGMDWVVNHFEKTCLDPMRENTVKGAELLSKVGGDFRMPEMEHLKFLEKYNSLGRGYEIIFKSPEKHFEEMALKHGKQLPVIKSDFNPLMQGCYSSRIRIKQYNRRLENLVAALEMLEVADHSEHKMIPPASEKLWETVTWNAFHDIICGSLDTNALRDTLNEYSHAERNANAALAENILSMRESEAGVEKKTEMKFSLFNSLPYPRTELVEIPLGMQRISGDSVKIYDHAGMENDSQVLNSSELGLIKDLDINGKEIGTRRKNNDGVTSSVLVKVTLPPAAIRTFHVGSSKTKKRSSKTGLTVREDLLENRFLRAVIGVNGTIVSLFDKQNKTELADPGRSKITTTGMNNVMKQPDRGDLWLPYAGPINGSLLYTAELHDPVAPSGAEIQRRGAVGFISADAEAIWPPAIRVLERGPLRGAIEVKYKEPNITTVISLAADEKMLRFTAKFMPAGKKYRLRVAFPTSIKSGRIRTSIPCGHVTRKEGEYPAQDWMDYSDGKKGLCLLNKGLPGNNVTNGTLILSLFRAVAMEDSDTVPWYEEGIEQVFEYAICPFGPADKNYNPARLGSLFNRPLHVAIPDSGRHEPSMKSIVEIRDGNVEMMAFRKLGDNLEIRLYENAGKKGIVNLTLNVPFGKCMKTDANGNEIKSGDIKISGSNINFKIQPFEIVTLRCGK